MQISRMNCYVTFVHQRMHINIVCMHNFNPQILRGSVHRHCEGGCSSRGKIAKCLLKIW